MCKLLAHVAVAAGMTAGIVPAQSLLDQVNFRTASIGGFRLYGVSAYTGYSTSALPLGFEGGGATSISQQLGGSANYGASASFGWQPHARSLNFSLLYSLSYNGSVHFSELGALSHSLSLTASRKLFNKWSLTMAASADDSSMAQYLYQPSSLAVLTQLPASFDDLAAAMSLGHFSDAQAAAMLTGASTMESPLRGLLLGDRVLSYSATMGFTYTPSSRLSFHFASFSGGGQSRRGGTNGIPEEKVVLPRSMGISGGMGFSYALSPRTQVGLNLDENATINKYQHAYSTNVTASLARKMSKRWFLGINGGGSHTRMTQATYALSSPIQAVGGGFLGFQTLTQTFVGSYNRSGSSSYGFAAGANTSVTGSWSWRRPGSRWSLNASAGQHQLRGAGFASLSGWEASGGISASLIAGTSISGQYVYFSSRGNYGGSFNNIIAQSVRVSLSWGPQSVQRR